MIEYKIFAVLLLLLLFNRIRIKNKSDLIIANANVCALDRQYTLSVDIGVMLDSFIEINFDEIIALNLKYAKLRYVNQETINKVRVELSNRVGERISTSFVNQLTTIYNKDCIGSLIADKCYMKVLLWAREINEVKEPDFDRDKDNETDINFLDFPN